MGKNHHWKRKKLTLAEQEYSLKKVYPESSCRIVAHKTLIWHGNLCPSPLSSTYSVTMEYSVGSRPKVRVSGNNIRKIDDPNFPHVYHRNAEKNTIEICLAYGDDFNGGMLLSGTYIPWAVEWLYYYEIWLTTGDWRGGGIHPK